MKHIYILLLLMLSCTKESTSQKPTDYHGLRNLEGWTNETKCIHCGQPIVKSSHGSWCHLTFRADSSGYQNCISHKNKIYKDDDGGTHATPDKKLFPDQPPYVYKHHIEISEPIEYDSIQDGTRITFSKQFKGDYAIIVRNPKGMLVSKAKAMILNKHISLESPPEGVAWFDLLPLPNVTHGRVPDWRRDKETNKLIVYFEDGSTIPQGWNSENGDSYWWSEDIDYWIYAGFSAFHPISGELIEKFIREEGEVKREYYQKR